jgi:fructosyl amine oxidase (glucosone-forming)
VTGVPGLHVAFTHSGATLGLIAGELLAEEIVRGEPGPLLAAFDPSRFAERPATGQDAPAPPAGGPAPT